MATAVTRVPGAMAPTSARSTTASTERGRSPVGTSSGRSCSLSVCWSTKADLDCSTTKESTPHWAEGPPSAAPGPPPPSQ